MEVSLCDICERKVSTGAIWPGSPPAPVIYRQYGGYGYKREMVLCPVCNRALTAVICSEHKKTKWKKIIRDVFKGKTARACGFEEKEKRPDEGAGGE